LTSLTQETSVKTPPLVDEAVGLTHREYQQKGIDFFWRTKRGMNTDAPGLGKTIQAALAAEPPCIVVAPTYLTQQWSDWLNKHLPNRKVVLAKGNRQEKVEHLLTPADFLIVNKEMLRTHIEELAVVAKRFRYNTVIFDESHHLRNRATGASRGAVVLGQIVKRVYLLTATPIWKEADDLYMPLQIMYPSVFTSYNDFVDTWCVTDADRWGVKVYGIKKSMLNELNQMMDVMRIGRTYDQAGRDLPPVIENTLRIEFDATERKRYDDAVNLYRLRLEGEDMFMSSYMEVMHTLRNLTGFEKIGPIVDTVKDTEQFHGGKYVIFTWYRDIADRLQRALPEATYISGDMKPDERQRLSKLGKPIITTIPALSEGVDMSWARMVIYAEEHWPPGSQVQSLMRVRRERQLASENPLSSHGYGGTYNKAFQTALAVEAEARKEINSEPILVYCVHVKDTIDEVIHTTSRRRSATAKEVLSEALGIYL
jgi:superfamily II DNA or RNA helicase